MLESSRDEVDGCPNRRGRHRMDAGVEQSPNGSID